MQAKFPIGTKFSVKRGKQGTKEYTVEDIHFTYNHAGELVRIRYVCSYELMGQKIIDYDVVQVTIQKALNVY